MIIRAQHTFQGVTGVPEDRYVNTFHLRANEPVLETSLAQFAQAIADFYTRAVPVFGTKVSDYLSPLVDAVGRNVKLYDLADPKPRAPIYTLTPATVALGGSNPLPEELSVCLSYAAVPNSGESPATHRGRIYIGPLNSTTMPTPTTENPSRPAVDFRDLLCAAGVALANDIAAGGHGAWVVWSEKLQNDSDIIRFWCDNAWDIQRRRGRNPSSRVTATV